MDRQHKLILASVLLCASSFMCAVAQVPPGPTPPPPPPPGLPIDGFVVYGVLIALIYGVFKWLKINKH